MVKTTVAFVAILLVAGCGSSTTTIHTTLTQYVHVEPVIDTRDGRSYPAVAIGGQVWLARNVSFPTEPSWCYEDQPGDCEANGRLYPWAKAGEACPGGWHVPSDDEWIELERRIGISKDSLYTDNFRGRGAAARLLEDGDLGFDARLSGYREPDGAYEHRGALAAFWSSTEADRKTAWSREFQSNDGGMARMAISKESAVSIRCVRDERVSGSTPPGQTSSL